MVPGFTGRQWSLTHEVLQCVACKFGVCVDAALLTWSIDMA